MAITHQHGFEGISSGTVLTASNSGTGGDPFASVTGSATVTATAAHLDRGVDLSGNGAATYVTWTPTATKPFQIRALIRLGGAPSVASQIVACRGSGLAWALNISTTKKLTLVDAAGANITASQYVLADATWYRISCWGNVGTSSSDGEIHFGIYGADSSTPLESLTNSTSANLGTAGINDVRIGKTGTSGNLSLTADDIAFGNSNADVGPYSGPLYKQGPSANPSTNTGNWLLSGSASDIKSALSDNDSATGIVTPDSPSGALVRLPMGEVVSGRRVKVSVPANRINATSGSIKTSLYQGSTLIGSRSFSVSDTYAPYEWTTDDTETGSLSGGSGLVVQIEATAA